MRIGCLQFAPQLGEIHNNLNRADAVLAKADPEELDTLDVLVLPELAFTGYNFKSLQQISPYLEPSGSGISSLWARTTALKYNTNVVVGYPERADVSAIWPTGPEYYNSAIIVNGDGETVANYRKSFLYSIDESWALEGKDGFFQGRVRGLGQTALGICMDINPYRFEAPWTSFEFGFHILEVRAHLVVVTMAWLTREDKSHFTRMPAEPDMETLTYWIQRLEPVIKVEDNEEVIVVFCNRTGIEDDAIYAGTSAVVGIKDGEVLVYGLLGRGTKEVLVVDTDDPPFAKLVHRPESESTEIYPRAQETRSPIIAKTNSTQPKEVEPATRASQTKSQQISGRNSKDKLRREISLPKIEIPEQRYRSTTFAVLTTPIAESPSVPTPTAPSPTPLSARPKLVTPGTWPIEGQTKSPYPRGDEVAAERNVVGAPLSSSRHSTNVAYNSLEHPTEKYFGLASQTWLETSMEARWCSPSRDPSSPGFPALPESPNVSSSLVRYASSGHRSRADAPKSNKSSSSKPERSPSRSTGSGWSSKSQSSEMADPARPAARRGQASARPAPQKPRNASRRGRYERRASETENPDADAMAERLDVWRRRTQSEMARWQDRTEIPPRERPTSPKSRNASRSGRPSDMGSAYTERALSLSRVIGASDSMLGSGILRPGSDIVMKDQRLSNGSAAQPMSDTNYHLISGSGSTASQVDGALKGFNAVGTHIEPAESRTMLWSEISKIVGEHMGRPESQEASRGRQRTTSGASIQARQGSREAAADVRATPSQTRQGNGEVIRSVRDPSLGPSADPDDEIVAEIIFRRPGLQNQPSRSNSAGITGTPEQGAGSTPSRRANSRSNANGESMQGRVLPSPLGKNDDKPRVVKETKSKKDSVPSPPSALILPQTSGSYSSVTSPPDLSGSSIHTLNSDRTSPVTPSPLAFEPSTPKAMVLGPEYEALLSAASNALHMSRFEAQKELVSDETVVKPDRPRSAIW